MPARPTNWKQLAPKPPPGTLSFAHQDALPRLPVPPLDSTLAKLKASLQPLSRDQDEYAAAAKKVDDFGNGIGKVLQARLEARQGEKAREHWLEEWWDDGAYLGYRDSVVVNVSYYYGFAAHPSHLPQSPPSRAAALTRSALLFRQQYMRGLLPPEAMRSGAICMDTYRWMFDCCRVPGAVDWSVSHAKDGDSGHIIVLRKGRVWKVPAYHGTQLISTADLQKHFQYIYDHTKREYPAVGVLTASNRDVWARDYEMLLQDPHNASIIHEIHSSAFIVCLDTEKPDGPVEFSRALWHGGVSGEMLGNRWVDKPCQFIIFDNGKAGLMGEHSVMDGTPTTRLCDDVITALSHPSFDHGSSSSSPLPSPTPLDWKMNQSIETSIQSASRAALDLISTQDLSYLLTPYGKSSIKGFGFSPDSWCQMVIQLAYARLQGISSKEASYNGATYEAATTRSYRKGRTEAIRVVTEESLKWVKSMDDETVNDKEVKRRLFREACRRHIADAREAGKGFGIDRHLLGLKKLLKKNEETPALFSDQLFNRSNYWILSTSSIFSKHFTVYGWGEVVPDGFGVAYMSGFDDRLQFTVTSRVEMPNKRFTLELERAAQDLQDLFDEYSRSKL